MKPIDRGTERREKYFKGIFDKDFDLKTHEQNTYYNNRVKNALDKAWELRNFEIELYWKRATYFWAFIATIFIGFFTVLGSRNLSCNSENIFLNKDVVLFLISNFGVIFSLAWVLVNKGSKFWQENWEEHIFNLEFEYYGDIYYELSPEQYQNSRYSVSKINLYVSIYVFIIWSLIFAYFFLKIMENLLLSSDNFEIFSVIIVIITLSIIYCFCKKAKNLPRDNQENTAMPNINNNNNATPNQQCACNSPNSDNKKGMDDFIDFLDDKYRQIALMFSAFFVVLTSVLYVCLLIDSDTIKTIGFSIKVSSGQLQYYVATIAAIATVIAFFVSIIVYQINEAIRWLWLKISKETIPAKNRKWYNFFYELPAVFLLVIVVGVFAFLNYSSLASIATLIVGVTEFVILILHKGKHKGYREYYALILYVLFLLIFTIPSLLIYLKLI